jgi:hypothetical protein
MIELTDIQTSVGKVLQANDYTVIASEVKEGFPKPCCFIEVMPASVAVENKYSELVTVSVEITYILEIETKEELIQNAEAFKNIFLYTPIPVKDRFLSVNEVIFDTDKSELITYFELEFYQETKQEAEEFPKMEKLNERVVTESHGTSEDIN